MVEMNNKEFDWNELHKRCGDKCFKCEWFEESIINSDCGYCNCHEFQIDDKYEDGCEDFI